ncbi:hypothetical protein LTR36_010372 [Oleoguttula mirabilis]|uniref:Nucleolar 27S pre-rRNA processing Urb2/Npa2 C-terminal domain-containing protein n=1 Tax=Oleoguttula mirabilis TaxID=1507867 RepID=A0AAV9J608_9PEZI|nr:hypothetical protein LTR36_010372 [Oleoguttula mirabilis]
MTASPRTVQPSLERLKALDSLPDLPSQLKEARRLCTHSARADMILKWLLDKLKKSETARSTAPSWTLLSTALRVLPPERLATLLASADVLTIVRECVTQSGNSAEVLLAVAGCVNLVLQLSGGPKGAPLKAVLSADAAVAAGFTGAWLNAVDQSSYDSPEERTRAIANHYLLNPALQIWGLRRRSADENNLFADACLVPAAYMLESFSPQPGDLSGKRKRKDGDAIAVIGGVRALESLIAKHVFLPARTAFSNEEHRSPAYNADNMDLDSEAPPPTDVQRRLAQYKAAKLTADDSLDGRPGRYYATVTVLLDIALRCLQSSSTPSQRLKERPWVEAVFAALLDCACARRPFDVGSEHLILLRMLPVVRKQAFSLSRAVLTNFVTTHGRESGHSELVHWEMVNEVVDMDANVFATNRAMAGRLFGDISASLLVLGRGEQPHVPSDLERGVRLANIWRDGVVTKVMQAFAQNRDLLTFIELWHEQLQHDFKDNTRCVWLEIGSALGELVERHLTGRQIQECVARYQQSITAAQAPGLSVKEVRAARIELCASVIVLYGFLGGVHSSALVDSLQGPLGELFEDLLKLFHQDPAATAECPQIWTLCGRVFGMWFPAWAAGQASEVTILDKTDNVSFSSAVEHAETFATAVRKDKNASPSAMKAACEAETFLTMLSDTLRHYDSIGRALELVDRMAQRMPTVDLQPLLTAPATLNNLQESNVRNDLLIKWLAAASGLIESGQDDSAVMDSVRAIVATAVASSQTAVIEDIVRVTLTFLEPEDPEEEHPSDVAQALLGLRVLVELPATALSKSQRKRVLDGVAALEHFQKTGSEVLQGRLLVMIRMLELSCPEARICNDTAVIWKLGNPAYDHEGLVAGTLEPPYIRDDEKTVELLEQIVGLVMKQLISRQGHDAGQAMLLSLATEAKQHIEMICQSESTFSGNHRTFSILKVILSHLDTGLRPEMKERCLAGAAIKRYAKFLVRTAKKLHSQDQDGDTPEGRHLPRVLGALLVMPRAITEAESTTFDFRAKLTSLVTDMLGARALDNAPGFAQVQRVTLPQCMELIGRWDLVVDDEAVSNVAARLLSVGLQPREHAALLAAFQHGCTPKPSQGGSMVLLLERLLPKDRSASASKLTLLQTAISKLDREHFDGLPETAVGKPQETLYRLLRSAQEAQDLTTRRRACACIVTVLREKPFMTNQYAIETVVSILHALVLAPGDVGGVVFLDACRIFTILLQQYRSRLKDRMNLVVPLLEALISRLFGHAKDVKAMKRKGLTARHARVLARVLQLLCNPPAHIRSRSKTSDLVDDARKAQAHVGQYVQFVLHYYCRQVLDGTLAEGVSDAIRPGLWAVIEAMQVNDTSARWVLSAAMSGGEREQLGRVYGEYETFGKGKSG